MVTVGYKTKYLKILKCCIGLWKKWRWQQNDSVNLKMDQQRWSNPKTQEQLRTKKYFKSNLRVLWDNTQRPNICNIRTPEGKKGGVGKDKIHNKITAESLAKLGKCYVRTKKIREIWTSKKSKMFIPTNTVI